MPSLIAVLALAGIALWMELPGLLARKRKREIAVFLALLLAGTVLYAALTLHVQLPNPLLLIKLIYGGHA